MENQKSTDDQSLPPHKNSTVQLPNNTPLLSSNMNPDIRSLHTKPYLPVPQSHQVAMAAPVIQPVLPPFKIRPHFYENLQPRPLPGQSIGSYFSSPNRYEQLIGRINSLERTRSLTGKMESYETDLRGARIAAENYILETMPQQIQVKAEPLTIGEEYDYSPLDPHLGSVELYEMGEGKCEILIKEGNREVENEHVSARSSPADSPEPQAQTSTPLRKLTLADDCKLVNWVTQRNPILSNLEITHLANAMVGRDPLHRRNGFKWVMNRLRKIQSRGGVLGQRLKDCKIRKRAERIMQGHTVLDGKRVYSDEEDGGDGVEGGEVKPGDNEGGEGAEDSENSDEEE